MISRVVSLAALCRARLFSSTVVRSAIMVSGLSLFCKLAAAGKEVLIASRLGTGNAVDVYLMAFLLPAALINITGGSLAVAAIPHVMAAREKGGEKEAHRLYSSLLLAVAAAALCLIALAAIASPWIMAKLAGEFGPAKIKDTLQCFLVLLPMCLTSTLGQIWGAMLNSKRRFLASSLSPILTTTCTFVAVGLLYKSSATGHTLAGATALGSVIEAAFLATALRRSGFAVLPKWQRVAPGTVAVFRECCFLALNGVMTGAVLSINQSLASRLGPGSVACFGYGTKIIGLITSIGSVGISSVLLPHFSAIAATADWGNLQRAAKKYVLGTFLAMLPVTALIMIFAETTIHLAFQRGTFTAADTRLVAHVHAASALQLPFVLPALIGARILVTLGATKRLLAATFLNVLSTVLLSAPLSKVFGVAGLALSASIMYAIATAGIFYLTWTLLRSRQTRISQVEFASVPA